MVVVKVKSINGNTYDIPITSGSVKVDRTSQDVRRTVNFTTNDPTLVPRLAQDPLNIYGNHVYVYRGVLWNSDAIDPRLWTCNAPIPPDLLRPTGWASNTHAYELVPLGVFRINTVNIDESEDGSVTISVDGSDISANISKNHWTSPVTVWKTPYTVPVSPKDTTPEQNIVATTVVGAIKALIMNRWPQHSIFGDPSFHFNSALDKPLTKQIALNSSTGGTSSSSNSPWQDISALSAAIGCELYVDAEGCFTLKTIADPNAVPPVWDLLDGEGGLLVKATRVLSDAKTVNYVIATGANTGTTTPLKAVAQDTDPNSPTNVNGLFGRVVQYDSGKKLLTTQTEVEAAAQTYLNWFAGGDEQVSVSGVVMPALDVNDVIRVRRRNVGIYEPNVISAEIAASTGLNKVITHIKVKPIAKAIVKGTSLTIQTNFLSQSFIVNANANVGATELSVIGTDGKGFKPKSDFRPQTIIVDSSKQSDGALNYYIDQLTIPLDIDQPMQIVARERRVGSKKDSIKAAAYAQGY